MRGEERAGRGCRQLLELANARVRALPQRERTLLYRERDAERCDENVANIILRRALRE